MHLANFRRFVLWAAGVLTLTVGVHQAALLYGMSPITAITAATVAVFFATVFFAAATIATVFFATAAFVAFAAAFVAATVAVFATVFFAVATIFAVVAVFAVAALAANVATEYRLKFRWVALMLGIEGATIFLALTISAVAGPGALVGLVGVALLGGLWATAPHLQLAITK